MNAAPNYLHGDPDEALAYRLPDGRHNWELSEAEFLERQGNPGGNALAYFQGYHRQLVRMARSLPVRSR